MISNIISNVVSPVLDKVLPDNNARAEAKEKIRLALIEQETEIKKAAAEVIKAEAASGFLGANWRPITMLSFVVLIFAYWFGFAEVPETTALEVFELIKIGLGGYVVGRSAEKIVPAVIAAKKAS